MSIAENLYRYLILTGHLPLPGIGVLRVEKIPVAHDIATKTFLSPQYSFSLQHTDDADPGKVFMWLSHEMQVPETDAVKMINDFSQAIKDEIMHNKTAAWEGVGIFKKKLDNTIVFEPAEILIAGSGNIIAEKVLHENASHTMVVGDTEMTSSQMAELIGAPGTSKDYGWQIALILLAASLIFIIYYFAHEGLDPAATAIQRQLGIE